MENTTLEPYLFFGGRCEEAVAFYGSALGAKVEMMMRYNESPQPMPPGAIPPGFDNKVMHASLTIGGKRLMVSDGNEQGAKFDGFALSLSYPSKTEAEKAFNALAQGGSINMPLSQTFWSPLFGMVTDGFGVLWMISLDTPKS
ncbi:MAG: VOC family protein [Nibricoccus sp.]